MSQDRDQIKVIIDDNLTDGVSPILDFPEHNNMLKEFADSYLNLISDEILLGAKEHNPARAYTSGSAVVKYFQFWVAKNNITANTPWDSVNWINITSKASLDDYNLSAWDPDFNGGAGYSTGAQVERGDLAWESNVDSNTEDPLINGGGEWKQIVANDGKFGNTWAEGLYLQDQVVLNPNDRKLYYSTVASIFDSNDITTEIGLGQWVLLHDLGVNPVTQIDNTDSPYAAAWGEVLAVDATAGNVIINLPPSAGSNGKFVEVQRLDEIVANNVDIVPDGVETVDGATSFLVYEKRASFKFRTDGNNVFTADSRYKADAHFAESLPPQSNSTAVELNVLSKTLNLTAGRHQAFLYYGLFADNTTRRIVVRTYVNAVLAGETRYNLTNTDEILAIMNYSNQVLPAGTVTIDVTLATEGGGGAQNSSIASIRLFTEKIGTTR